MHRLADPEHNGGRRYEPEREAQGGATDGRHSPWGEFNILPFRDGKLRRVEPESFPLVDGVPGRLGLLRGYGNAIVPAVAAAFIKCCGLTDDGIEDEK